jgi:hypothetical protein
MDTITLKSTDVQKIKLGRKKADGLVDTIPADEVFSVVNETLPDVVPGSIDETDPLNPILVVNALTLPSAATETGMVLKVSDSGGDVVYELAVNYPVPALPDSISADLSSVVIGTQDPPTVPGP